LKYSVDRPEHVLWDHSPHIEHCTQASFCLNFWPQPRQSVSLPILSTRLTTCNRTQQQLTVRRINSESLFKQCLSEFYEKILTRIKAGCRRDSLAAPRPNVTSPSPVGFTGGRAASHPLQQKLTAVIVLISSAPILLCCLLRFYQSRPTMGPGISIFI
jgi:hypothetical protein